MRKHISLVTLIVALSGACLHALESNNDGKPKVRQPLPLKELAANVCVDRAARNKSFFEKLKQAALTIPGLMPFNSSLLFTKTSATRGLPGIAEIIVSPAEGLIITRDMHHKAAVHTYGKDGAIRRITSPHSDEPSRKLAEMDYSPVVLTSSDLNRVVLCTMKDDELSVFSDAIYPTRVSSHDLDLRLGSSLAKPNLSFFARNGNRDAFMYNHEKSTIYDKGFGRPLAPQCHLPKHDLYAISSDGNLFVGACHKDKKAKSKIRLFDLEKYFNAPSPNTGIAESSLALPLVSLTLARTAKIAISPDNQEIACLPPLTYVHQDDNAPCARIYAISALLNHKRAYRKLLCPDRATPSCITWVGTDRIALGSHKGHITLYKRETGEQLLALQSQNLRVTALAHDQLKNILIAGYETTHEGQVREAIHLTHAEQTSPEDLVTAAILHRAAATLVWSNLFDAAYEKLPAYAQQLIADTMTPHMRRITLEIPQLKRGLEMVSEDLKAMRDIERSASRLCSIL